MPLPDLAALPGSEPTLRNADDAPAYWSVGGLWMVLADGGDTGGRHSMMEQLLPKGSGPPPHRHVWSDETFYILDGAITFLIGDTIRAGRKGDYLVIPRNTRHGFRVDSDTARILNGYTPASMEAMLGELAQPAPERVLPPKGPPPSTAMLPELLARYGLDWLPGPDPLRPGHPAASDKE